MFSERMGFKKKKTMIQTKSIDLETRNSLWTALLLYYFPRDLHDYTYNLGINIRNLLSKMWIDHFKLPIDSISDWWPTVFRHIREYFYSCEWNGVYDLIEFVANNFEVESTNREFIETCNRFLEREASGYRFVGNKVTPIINQIEVSAIEEALKTPITPVAAHLDSALEKLSDRKNPDYRNSIKESISAVEAICRLITKDKNATLGQALDKIEREMNIDLHGALKKGFSSIYGYSSSAEGIRHSMIDESTTLRFEDAKFMLVSCSAFVNYLISKASSAGIGLET